MPEGPPAVGACQMKVELRPLHPPWSNNGTPQVHISSTSSLVTLALQQSARELSQLLAEGLQLPLCYASCLVHGRGSSLSLSRGAVARALEAKGQTYLSGSPRLLRGFGQAFIQVRLVVRLNIIEVVVEPRGSWRGRAGDESPSEARGRKAP